MTTQLNEAGLKPVVDAMRNINIGDIETASKCSQLEEIDNSTNEPIFEIPKYDQFQHLIAVPDPQLQIPQSVDIDKETGNIYVADSLNQKIKIFSEIGNKVNEFENGSMTCPYGVLVYRKIIYVTDWGIHAISKFSIRSYTKTLQVGKKGPGKRQFDTPQNLSLSPDKYIYVADCKNDRLQILDGNLHFKGRFRHHLMLRPVDVKFSHSQLFVLTIDNPCLHIFTLSREFVRSIISSGFGLQTRSSYSFCLDQCFSTFFFSRHPF